MLILYENVTHHDYTACHIKQNKSGNSHIHGELENCRTEELDNRVTGDLDSLPNKQIAANRWRE